MTLDATTITTPIGSLSLIARDGAAVAAGFATVEEMAARLDDPEVRTKRDLGGLSRAVAAYFAGDLTAMDDLAVEQPGGEFFQLAWKVMREVPAGETINYAELAERAGRPRAVRAAGSACARNLVAPIVPCHRILRTGGALGGYYYGLETKQWLLDHEQRHS
ncbi:MAG TPA: methylated-DNA--[protein]-cysteine S-methyltransferase [Mycobacteriales bacterium]|jgi:methylated-DNA-[protein]-cysteine S-methyltransferase|nr:methylated-DNA--[protein]-cysteine S-methyltransferase [Mycobacteriales bacterium]